jgi:hypothetical protein
MGQLVLPGGQPFSRDVPPASTERGLSSEDLEHGAYYAGKLGATAVIARWHAKQRRFVFGEYALGGQRVRSVAHVADSATGERFTPLTRIEPKDSYRVSDYAFETAG